MVVVPVVLTPLLFAVHRVIRGIEIDHDLLSWLAVHVQERVHEQRVHLILVRHDLLVTMVLGRFRASQFHPVQRARSRQGICPVTRPRPCLACQIVTAARQRQQAVPSDLVVVVEIIVTQREPQHPLPGQRFDRVLCSGRIAVVLEASPKPPGQVENLVRFPQ